MACATASGSRTTPPARSRCPRSTTSTAKQDGVWKTWYPNGKQKQQVSFKNGKRHGTSTEWDDKGKKLFEAEYADGKLNGTATRWFPDGRKIVQDIQRRASSNRNRSNSVSGGTRLHVSGG